MADPRPKLQLHFDINQTILVSDPSVKVNTKEGLNIAIAKAAYLRRKDGAPLKMCNPPDPSFLIWHDGTAVDIGERNYSDHNEAPALVRSVVRVSTKADPGSAKFIGQPPEGCVSCYDLFGRDRCRKWVNSGIGQIFRPVFNDLCSHLTWPDDVPVVPELVVQEDGVNYHLLVPSFFNLIVRLKLQGRAFNLVLRTMGSDLDPVGRAIDAFCNEKHPLFAEPMKFVTTTDVICKNATHWTMVRDGDKIQLQSGVKTEGSVHGDVGISQHLEAAAHSIGIQDNYQHWRDANYLPAAGKPMWLTVSDFRVHPIFFDDNIHEKEDDSIVSVRAREDPSQPFRQLSGEVTMRLHNVTLVKAEIIQAIFDPFYFLDCVQHCEQNMSRMRGKPGFLDELYTLPE